MSTTATTPWAWPSFHRSGMTRRTAATLGAGSLEQPWRGCFGAHALRARLPSPTGSFRRPRVTSVPWVWRCWPRHGAGQGYRGGREAAWSFTIGTLCSPVTYLMVLTGQRWLGASPDRWSGAAGRMGDDGGGGAETLSLRTANSGHRVSRRSLYAVLRLPRRSRPPQLPVVYEQRE